jgi:malonate-semialdehyde dehydrogenase (acetylating)/methylmalonate-semialdehyde dehydrogenase
MRTIEHWIAGTAVGSSVVGPVFDPASGELRAQVAMARDGEVDAAVAAAGKAFADWAQVPLTRRARIMFTFRDLLERHEEELAAVITREHGKVLADARGEVARGREVVEFACGIGELLKGDYSDQVSGGVDAYSFRQPLGVCAGITPFNFPAMVPLWMHPIAIACGNTFVLKPSERVPSASNLIAGLYADAGLPDGVFNVVHGDRIAVEALLDHPGVAAVSFVGSTPVAQHIHRRASAAGKRVQALGGAKNHAVVLPDADLDFAADQITAAAYGSTGQRCMAVSAVVAVDTAGDALVERLAARAKAIRVGAGTDPASEMGPLVTARARERVLGYVDRGVAAGAVLVADGRQLAGPGSPPGSSSGGSADAGSSVAGSTGTESGFFIGPCLFDRVTPDMEVYTDEVFGPVLVVLRAGTLDEAIRLVNDCPYGNGTAIFTADGAAARRFQREVTVGMIGVNVPIPVPLAFYSFGGWKSSLFGDTHIHGPEGVRFYTRAKAVTSRWPEPAGGPPATLHFPSSG